MKLVSTTIADFRSITSAYKVALHDFTVLVGPNNEGKSNVLAAISLALSLLESGLWRAVFFGCRAKRFDTVTRLGRRPMTGIVTIRSVCRKLSKTESQL